MQNWSDIPTLVAGALSPGRLRQDMRHCIRAMKARKALALFVVLSFAVGIGVPSAVFGVADQVLFVQPGGVARPAELRRLYLHSARTFGDQGPVGTRFQPAAALGIDSAFDHPDSIAEYTEPDTVPMQFRGGVRIVNGSYASASYFRVLGVRTVLGRTYGAQEDRLGSPAFVAVISARLWQRYFAGDPSIVGRVATIDHHGFTIIGVVDRAFRGVDLNAADVWLPLATMPSPSYPGAAWYSSWLLPRRLDVIARPGGTERDARLAALATAVFRTGERVNRPRRPDTLAAVTVGPIVRARASSEADPNVVAIRRLLVVAVAVLLIVCANVAGLLLTAAMSRRRQLAVQLTLGLSRARMMWRLLLETIVLSLVGAAAAVAFGGWGGTVLRRMLFPSIEWAGDAFDLRLLVFGAGLALVSGLAAGLVPAWQLRKVSLSEALKAGAGHSRATKGRMQRGLIVGQIGISMLMLVAAVLFLRSLWRVEGIRLGYDANHVVSGTVLWRDPAARFLSPTEGHARLIAGMPRVAARLEDSPAIRSAALASAPPMNGYASGRLFLEDGRPVPGIENGSEAMYSVSGRYFETVGLRVVRGHGFRSPDAGEGSRAVVVNEMAARRFWPRSRALGACLRFGVPTAPCYTVVGVVEDSHLQAVIEGPSASVFFSLAQLPLTGGAYLVARADPDRLGEATAALRGALKQEFPDGEPWVKSVASTVAPQYRPWEARAVLFATLATIALFVATIGVYGVMSHAVNQRLQEMAVRSALGARPRDILLMVLRDGGGLVAGGVAVGLLLALGAGELIASLLYDVTPRDPGAMIAAAVVLAVSGVLACAVPAWRAARLEPLAALRAE